jgi:methanethiol S-methyltransferase
VKANFYNDGISYMKPSFPEISPRALLTWAKLVSGLAMALFAGFLALGSYGWINLGLGDPAILAWDTGLSFCFFLQHSGMIRRTFRRLSGGVIPSHFHPAVYALASGLVLLLLMIFWQESNAMIITFQGILRWILHGVFIAAGAGFLWTVRSLGALDLVGEKAVVARLKGRESVPPELVIRGPYRWVRHPIYTLSLLMIWSCPTLSVDRLLFNILWTAWIVVGTRLEERDLVREFGDVYRDYQQRVPMLIPGPRRSVNSS